MIISNKDIVIGSFYAEDMNKFQQTLPRGLGGLKIKKLKNKKCYEHISERDCAKNRPYFGVVLNKKK